MSISVRDSYYGDDSISLSVNDCITRIQNKCPTYEVIPDTPFKFNFDFDLKPNTDEDFDAATFEKCCVPLLNHILNLALEGQYQIEPIIKCAVSCGDCYDAKNKTYHKKYSARFYCQNIIATRQKQKSFVTELNHKIQHEIKNAIVNGEFIKSIPEHFLSYISGIEPKDIVFDTAIYSSNRKMRCLFTNKPNENRPLLPYADTTIEDTILTSSWKSDAFVDNSVTIITQPVSATSPTKSSNKYIELMHLIGNKISRKHHLQLAGWAVKYISKNEYLDLFDDSWKSDAEKLWDDFSAKKRPITIITIATIAKEVCPDKYNQWRQKHDLVITKKILEKGEADVCEFIKDDLSNRLIFCNGAWYGYNEHTKLWSKGFDPTHIIVRHIQNEISLLLSILWCKKSNPKLSKKDEETIDDDIKDVNAIYRKVTTTGYSSQCKKSLSYLLCDNDFYKKIDNTPYRIPFKNGILNLETMQLEEFKEEDYITTRINRDYTPADTEFIRKELWKICNCNDSHLEYYLSTLGYSLCGAANREQLFWSFYGATASNGKSTIFDALKEICPEMVSRVSSDFYELNNKNTHKTLATFSGLTRIVYANELSKKKQDVEFIKQLADGTTMPYNKLYGNKADLRISFKSFIISNNTLNFTNDNGMTRRLKTCEFRSSFSQTATEDNIEQRIFVADTSFPEKLSAIYADALLSLLFEYANKYITDGYKLKPYPDAWNEENNNVLETNDVYKQIFKEFEFHKDFQVSKDDIEKVYRRYGKEFKLGDFRDELKRLPQFDSCEIHYDSQKPIQVNGKRIKGWWYGLRIKEQENPENSCEDTETYIEV